MPDILDLLKRGEVEEDLTVEQHDLNFTGIESAVNFLHSRTEVLESIVAIEGFSGFYPTPLAMDHVIELDAPVAGAITALAHRVNSGSLSLSALVNDIPISGLSGLTSVASKQLSLPSGVNAYGAGATTMLRVTNVASGTQGFAFTLTRRPGASAIDPRAFWAFGPRQQLPFWNGGFGDLSRLTTLMAGTAAGSGSNLDLVHHIEAGGNYAGCASRTITSWTNPALPHHTMLLNGNADALLWSSSPFCSGSGTPPGAVPDVVAPGDWISAARPPGYIGSESEIQRAELQRDVWELAATGRLDEVWRAKFLAFKKLYFVAFGLINRRIVLAVSRQLNAPLSWGSQDFLQGHNAAAIPDADGAAKIKEGLRRYIDIFKDVFGSVQPSITGDVAFSSDRLWALWSPLSAGEWDEVSHADIRATCPDNADLVGVDLINTAPPTLTYTDWQSELSSINPNATPKGLGAWLDWATTYGRPFALPEWRLKNEALPLPSTDGGDNPVFIRGVLQELLERPELIAFQAYGNSDPTASSSVPGSIVGSWTLIDDPGEPTPGDGIVNKAASRAYRSFFRGREEHPASSLPTNLLSAGGARRLVKSYTGPLLQVRRGSDSTLSDIGCVRDTGMLDIDALETFVGGSDGEIMRFYNQAFNDGTFAQLGTNAIPLRIAIAGKVTRLQGVPFPVPSAVGSPFSWYFHGFAASYTGTDVTGMVSYRFPTSVVDTRMMSLVLNAGGDAAASSVLSMIQRGSTGPYIQTRRQPSTFTMSVSHGGNGNVFAAATRIFSGTICHHCGENSGSIVSSAVNLNVNRIVIGGTSAANNIVNNGQDNFGDWAFWKSDIGVAAIDAGLRNARGYLDGY